MITWTGHLHSDKCKSGIKFHINHRGALFQVLDNICFISHRKLNLSMLSLASGNPNSRLLCHMLISKLKTFFISLEEKDRWVCKLSLFSIKSSFFSTPVRMHGGLLCIAFCLSICLCLLRLHYAPLQWYMGYLCTRKAQYAPWCTRETIYVA